MTEKAKPQTKEAVIARLQVFKTYVPTIRKQMFLFDWILAKSGMNASEIPLVMAEVVSL